MVQRKDFFYEHRQGIQKTSPSGEKYRKGVVVSLGLTYPNCTLLNWVTLTSASTLFR
jgi:hypothetical protein